MARRKLRTRVKSMATTRVKSTVGLTQKRSAKSYAKYELKAQAKKHLTPNQLEFLDATDVLRRRVKRYAKKVGIVLNPDDLLSILPSMPKKITKKYLSKLVETTAKELLEAYLPELKIAEPLMDAVVEAVVDEAQKTPLEKSTLPENESDEYIPTADIIDNIIEWIAGLPDSLPLHSRTQGFYWYDLTPYKNVFMSAINDNIGTNGEDYLTYLEENQYELLADINHIPHVSDQDDLETTCVHIYQILSYNKMNPVSQSMISDLSEMLSAWS